MFSMIFIPFEDIFFICTQPYIFYVPENIVKMPFKGFLVSFVTPKIYHQVIYTCETSYYCLASKHEIETV